MKDHPIKCVSIILCSIVILCIGTVTIASATPLILNFEIADPLNGIYDETHFSYKIDLDSPFWSSVEGTDPFDQNAYKYNVDFYDSDPIIGLLPDLIVSTGQTIHDWESGYTHFSDSLFSFNFSADHTYIKQIINLVNSGHTWLFNGFYCESLGFTSVNYPSGPLPGVRLYSTTSVPEPATILLFAIGLIGLTGTLHKKKWHQNTSVQ